MHIRKQLLSQEMIERFKSAIRTAQREAVQQSLNDIIHEYDININDAKTKYTLLHFAITKATESNELEMLEIIKALKNAGCDINKTANDSLNNSPIHTACRRGLTHIVTWLIENGVDSNVKDKTGQMPIDYIEKQISNNDGHMNAGVKKRLNTIKDALLQAENNVTLPDNTISSDNITPAIETPINATYRFGLFSIFDFMQRTFFMGANLVNGNTSTTAPKKL